MSSWLLWRQGNLETFERCVEPFTDNDWLHSLDWSHHSTKDCQWLWTGHFHHCKFLSPIWTWIHHRHGHKDSLCSPVFICPLPNIEAQTDANGLRIVTLEAIRKEIWLNHGSIAMKRLMKLFDIKKKSSPERQNKFREVIKELCTMKTDPIGGRMLVLKQHYSNMG